MANETVPLLAAMVARSTGDLHTCIEVTSRLLKDGSAVAVADAATVLAAAAFLARDEEAMRLAVDRLWEFQRKNPGFTAVADLARHRLDLLLGQDDSAVDPDLTADASWPMTSTTLWLVGREAIDAGANDLALTGVGNLACDDPHSRAVLAAVTAAASGDEDAWHSALEIAVNHDLRLIVVDALEGLGIAAARTESWAECVRLLTAGQRLRDELDYRWRYRSEQTAVDQAHRLSTDNLDAVDAEQAEADGQGLDWRAAAEYAGRARGERKRPRHGWDSLTPTEQQVVALVTDGHTNAQIAAQLIMGRATVKTHLAHIFNKLGVTTRAQLAGEAARRIPE